MRKLGLSIIFFFIGFSMVIAQQALDQFLQNPYIKNANVGVYIKNLRTGEVLASYRESNLIPPASVQKLLTTSAAIELLGSDFRFSTYLETDGTIENGVLKGNLYIRGTGDPTLGSQKVGNQNFLSLWVRKLQEAGIQKVEGNIVGDASFLDADAINPQWIWEDIGNYYAPGQFGIAYMDNTLNIQLRSAAIGSVAEIVKTIPEIADLQFENHIRCTSITYDGAYIHGVPYSNIRFLVGSIPSNLGIFGVRGDIPNPPLLLAQHLLARMQTAGIEVSGRADYIAEQGDDARYKGADNNRQQRRIIYEYQSVPLVEILQEINQQSNNMYAEQVFRYLGSRMGVPASIRNSIDVINSCLKNRGVRMNNCFIFDGCGLSPQDAVSTETLVSLLSFMNKSVNRDAFRTTLPVAGESGTLKGFLLKTPLQGNVKAKSGTTSRIKSYAGYMTLKNGDEAAFAVIVNNASCKARNVQPIIERLLLNIYQAQ